MEEKKSKYYIDVLKVMTAKRQPLSLEEMIGIVISGMYELLQYCDHLEDRVKKLEDKNPTYGS